MNFWTTFTASLLTVKSGFAAPNLLSNRDDPKCSDFITSIHGSAPKKVFPQPPANITDPTALVNYLTSFGSGRIRGILITIGSSASLGTVVASGNFNISLRYCEPQVADASRVDTSQFLVHGVTYNKNYWQGLEMMNNTLGSTMLLSKTTQLWQLTI